MILWHAVFNTQHEFVISDDQKVGDGRPVLYHLNTLFSCGMFENPHFSVHSQSIQSRESKFFLTPKFCKRTRSMRALYGWISMNECLGARKSLKRTWWVEMTLKYSSKKNQYMQISRVTMFLESFLNSKDYSTWVVFFKVVFLSSPSII